MDSDHSHSLARSISQGDVFWVRETADASGVNALSHPYLVLQEDVFNRSRLSTIIACALTSNLKRATEPGNVLLDDGEGGLPQRSVIVVSQLESFERPRLGERLGHLSNERVQQALAGLRFQQRSFFRE